MTITGPFKFKTLVLASTVLMFSSNIAVTFAQTNKSTDKPIASKKTLKNIVSAEDTDRFADTANPQALDLISLYQLAAQNDPNFNAAKGALMAGKENFWQGLSFLLPQIVGSYSTTQTDLRYAATPGSSDRSFQSSGWNVQLTQPLFNWAAYEKFKAVDALTGIAEATFAQAQQDLVLRVTQAYFDALTAQDNLDLYRNKKVLIQEQWDQAKRNFEIGTSTIVDTKESRSRLDLVIAQELQAQTDLVLKKNALELLVGQSIPAIRPLAQAAKIDMVVDDRKVKYRKKTEAVLASPEIIQAMNLPTGQSLEDWVKQAEEVNYDVIAKQLAVNSARSNLNSARAGHLPSLSLVSSVGYTNAGGTTVGLGPNPTAPTNVYNNQIGIQLTVPLFSGGYTQSVVRQSAGLLEQAQATYDLSRRTTALNTKQAYLGFNSGLAQIKAYEAAEKSALSSLESNRLGYDVGVRINIDVLNAQDQLFTTRATLYKARYDTIINGLKLKSAASVLADDDLKSVNSLLR